MNVFRYSRMLGVARSTVTDFDGRIERAYGTRTTTATERAGTRRLSMPPGADFPALAEQAYGAPQLWWVLADANPGAFFPLDVSAGDVIAIPPRSALAGR